eukprot:6590801-Heterocapsa_arctica.AAC.1
MRDGILAQDIVSYRFITSSSSPPPRPLRLNAVLLLPHRHRGVLPVRLHAHHERGADGSAGGGGGGGDG